MQRVDVDDAAGDLQRPAERDAHVANRLRDRVAVDHHVAALRIDDQARAVVVLLGHARDGVGHVEVDQHQRGRDLAEARIAAGRRSGRGRPRAARRRARRSRARQGHSPSVSSRRQRTAGNQRRSMRATRTLLVPGSSSVMKRTVKRCWSALPASSRSRSSSWRTGSPSTPTMTLPRGMPAAANTKPGLATYRPSAARLKCRACW